MFTSVTDKAALVALKLKNDVMGPVSSLKEKGQGLVEYAIILALVAIVVIAVMNILGLELADIYAGIACNLDPNTTLPTIKGITPTCDAYIK